jgi:hypothetical protein
MHVLAIALDYANHSYQNSNYEGQLGGMQEKGSHPSFQ